MKTCPNCKTKVTDDSLFCSGCGFHFEAKSHKMDVTSSKNPLKNLLIILIVIFIMISMAIGGFIWWNQPAKRVKRLLDLGQKYLAELDYDQSIITLEQALRIDPKNSLLYSNLAEVYLSKADHVSDDEEKLSLYESANENYENALYYADGDTSQLNDAINKFYLNWAQIYLDQKDYKMAEPILKHGFDITEQDIIKDKLDEVEDKNSNFDLYNQNARAFIIDLFQVYQPKSYDTLSTNKHGVFSHHINCSYTYDETGKLPLTISFDNSPEERTEFRYDNDGNPIYMEYHYKTDEWTEEYYYNDKCQLTQSVRHFLNGEYETEYTDYEYDENGIYIVPGSKRHILEYDNKGRIITSQYVYSHSTITYKFEYDELDRIIKKTRLEESDTEQSSIEYTFNY